MNPSSIAAPYSEEAERALLGAVIVNPEMFEVVAAFLDAEDFFLLRHRYIWQALARVNGRSEPIDFLTVSVELENMGKESDVGGMAYLTQLIAETPTSMHAEIYGRLVERTAIRRRLLQTADSIRELALDEDKHIEAVELEAAALLMDTHRASSNVFTGMREAVTTHMDRTEFAYQNPRALLGLSTGFAQIDKLTRGLRPTRLYIVAGRPGMGKSSLLSTIAANVAKRKQGAVAYFTLEMTENEVVNNWIAGEVGIDIDALEDGNMTPQQYSNYVTMAAQVAQWNMFIDDVSGLTPAGLRLKCRRLKHDAGLALVVVDYIQLMSGGGEVRYTNRDQEIGHISKSMKNLARELNVPVLAAAQIGRAVEGRADKRPTLSDLRESGNLEQDCDVALLMYRDDYYNPVDPPNEVSPTEAAIAKNRVGRTGMAKLGFFGQYKKFVDLTEQQP